MKIALCLHGYYDSSGGPNSGSQGYKYIKEQILKDNDVDVFVHSWDIPAQEEILTNYSPASFCFEEQYDFKTELESFDVGWFEERFERNKTMYKNSIFQTLSFLYSRKRSLELKREYENKHRFEYDCVVLCRFDLGTRGKEHPQVFYATDIDFNLNADMELLHMKYWDQFNWGLPDHWFYSNTKTMDIVGTLYDKVFNYLQKDSDYVHSVVNGWIDSNQKFEFSNEMMLKEELKTPHLTKFEKWHCIDNHKIYKWFLYKESLSNKIGFGESKQKEEKFSIIMYSHSSYSDAWSMFFGQADMYFPNHKKYLFTDSVGTRQPPEDWNTIFYEECLDYNDRMASCLKRIPEELVMLHHEDMPLYLKPEIDTLNNISEVVKEGKVQFIKLLRGGLPTETMELENTKNIYKILDNVHYMAIQPSIWNKHALEKVYRETKINHFREFEDKASLTCIYSGIKGAYYYSGEPKVGLYHYASRIYPYIATAISKGKWNTLEYPGEIAMLADRYKVNLEDRGKND